MHSIVIFLLLKRQFDPNCEEAVVNEIPQVKKEIKSFSIDGPVLILRLKTLGQIKLIWILIKQAQENHKRTQNAKETINLRQNFINFSELPAPSYLDLISESKNQNIHHLQLHDYLYEPNHRQCLLYQHINLPKVSERWVTQWWYHKYSWTDLQSFLLWWWKVSNFCLLSNSPGISGDLHWSVHWRNRSRS